MSGVYINVARTKDQPDRIQNSLQRLQFTAAIAEIFNPFQAIAGETLRVCGWVTYHSLGPDRGRFTPRKLSPLMFLATPQVVTSIRSGIRHSGSLRSKRNRTRALPVSYSKRQIRRLCAHRPQSVPHSRNSLLFLLRVRSKGSDRWPILWSLRRGSQPLRGTGYQIPHVQGLKITFWTE